MNKNTPKIVDFNGTHVVSFIPKNTRVAALVDLEVLKRITSYLPEVDYYTIRNRLTKMIDNTSNLTQMLEILEAELAFHNTVNSIDEIDLKEAKINVDMASASLSDALMEELD